VPRTYNHQRPLVTIIYVVLAFVLNKALTRQPAKPLAMRRAQLLAACARINQKLLVSVRRVVSASITLISIA